MRVASTGELEPQDLILKAMYNDGQLWKDFQVYEDEPFLQDDCTLALMMNMDFFQPYKHVQYSVGAIYLTVLNLPREVRNKPENVLLVGLIPGPNEPERDINSFLKPGLFQRSASKCFPIFTHKKGTLCTFVYCL